MGTLFKEEQRFTQWWVWFITIAIQFILIWAIYEQVVTVEKISVNSTIDVKWVVMAIFIFAFIVLLWIIRLKTEIISEAIKMTFFPFERKSVKWSDVKSAKVLNYGFVGGWGVRCWTKYGTVYNVKGNMGLAIELNNGKKFLIGTQKKLELEKIVEKIKGIKGKH